MDTTTNGLDYDSYVKLDAFTSKTYRDVYPEIDSTRPELSQAGKVIVITGASRGLGRWSFAASFARADADAIVLFARSSINLAQTEKLIKDINPSTYVLPITLDICDEAKVKDAFDKIKDQVGVPDVLINNAGVLPAQGTITDQNSSQWWETHEVNVRGTYNVTKAFLQMTGPNPANPTTIINVTSAAGHIVAQGMSAYCLTKLAITQFTAFLKNEYPRITSVSLHPGMVLTDMGSSVLWLEPFMRDTAGLSGGTAVWLSTGDKAFLSGRYVAANWDVVELEMRKEEIIRDNLLTVCLRGRFGEMVTR